MKLKNKKNLIAIITTLIFLIWLIKSIEKETVIQLINDVEPVWIAVGIGFYCLVYLAKVARWKILLPRSSSSLKELLGITGIHNLAVRAFPNPTGELVFLHQAKRKNIPYSDSLAALTINRALDFVIIGFFFLIGATPFLASLTKPILLLLLASILFISGGIGFIIFVSSTPKTAQKIINKIFSSRMLARFQKSVEQMTSQFLTAFGNLKNWTTYFKTVLLSCIIWLSMFVSYFFFLRGFAIELDFKTIMLGGAVQIFANTIPNIGGLGIMEAGWAAGLGIAGIEKSKAIAGALAVDLMTLAGTIIFGLIGFLIQRGEFFASDKIK